MHDKIMFGTKILRLKLVLVIALSNKYQSWRI